MKNKERYDLNKIITHVFIEAQKAGIEKTNYHCILLVAEEEYPAVEVAYIEFEVGNTERVMIQNAINKFKEWLEQEVKADE